MASSASSALFDALIDTERPSKQFHATPPTAKAAGQWKSLFSSGQRKRKADVRPSAMAKPREAEQLYLDFGQRPSKLGEGCKICGMVYTKGQPEDEETHRRYHRRVVGGMSLQPSASERMVCPTPDGGRVVLILPTDPPDRLRKLREATELMAADLGGEPALLCDGRAFLVVGGSGQRHQLLGCAIAEPLQRAFCLQPLAESPSASDVVRHDGVPQLAQCGVSHIWVAATHRRRGVGRRLLDAIRSNMLCGFEVPLDRLAFSQPTAQGRALAQAYTGSERFLVYDERPRSDSATHAPSSGSPPKGA